MNYLFSTSGWFNGLKRKRFPKDDAIPTIFSILASYHTSHTSAWTFSTLLWLCIVPPWKFEKIIVEKIIKHVIGIVSWKNELLEHLVITSSFEAKVVDIFSNTLDFLTVMLFFHLSFIHFKIHNSGWAPYLHIKIFPCCETHRDHQKVVQDFKCLFYISFTKCHSSLV